AGARAACSASVATRARPGVPQGGPDGGGNPGAGPPPPDRDRGAAAQPRQRRRQPLLGEDPRMQALPESFEVVAGAVDLNEALPGEGGCSPAVGTCVLEQGLGQFVEIPQGTLAETLRQPLPFDVHRLDNAAPRGTDHT